MRNRKPSGGLWSKSRGEGRQSRLGDTKRKGGIGSKGWGERMGRGSEERWRRGGEAGDRGGGKNQKLPPSRRKTSKVKHKMSRFEKDSQGEKQETFRPGQEDAKENKKYTRLNRRYPRSKPRRFYPGGKHTRVRNERCARSKRSVPRVKTEASGLVIQDAKVRSMRFVKWKPRQARET